MSSENKKQCTCPLCVIDRYLENQNDLNDAYWYQDNFPIYGTPGLIPFSPLIRNLKEFHDFNKPKENKVSKYADENKKKFQEYLDNQKKSQINHLENCFKKEF